MKVRQKDPRSLLRFHLLLHIPDQWRYVRLAATHWVTASTRLTGDFITCGRPSAACWSSTSAPIFGRKYLKPQNFDLRLPQPRPSLRHLLPPLPLRHYIPRFGREVTSAPPSKLHPLTPLRVVVQGEARQPYSRRTPGAVGAASVVVTCRLRVSRGRGVRWVSGDPGTLWGVPASRC